MKHNSSHKIFNMIMMLRDMKIYKWIYRHPHLSMMILVLIAVIILYVFISFVFNFII